MIKVVIDADSLLYAAGYASLGEPEAHQCQTIKRMMEKIIEASGADKYEVFVEGEGNFREDVAVTKGYKANRKTAKPANYDLLRDYLIDRWGATPVEGIETDDMVSYILWQDYKACGGDPEKATIILSSMDKDLKNTPGWHYNPKSELLYWISLGQANRHFWYQMLAGDNTDNIPGLPSVTPWSKFKYSLRATKGFGDKSAKTVMAATKGDDEARDAVITCYIDWGLSSGLDKEEIKEYLIEQGTLLWMLREYDEFGLPERFQLEDEAYERCWTDYTGFESGSTDGVAAGTGGGASSLQGGPEAGSPEVHGGEPRPEPASVPDSAERHGDKDINEHDSTGCVSTDGPSEVKATG
jgi:hypothetical protein